MYKYLEKNFTIRINLYILYYKNYKNQLITKINCLRIVK